MAESSKTRFCCSLAPSAGGELNINDSIVAPLWWKTSVISESIALLKLLVYTKIANIYFSVSVLVTAMNNFIPVADRPYETVSATSRIIAMLFQ